MILSTVVLSTNARFGKLIVLQNLASDVALGIREAQVYGISVRRFSGANFDVSYGMQFQVLPAGTPSSYVLFGDLNGNGLYDSGETVSNTTIGGGFRIIELWARNAGSSVDVPASEVNIVFRRPEPDACMSAQIGSTRPVTFLNDNCTSTTNRVRIVLESTGGARSEVLIEASGQISVQ